MTKLLLMALLVTALTPLYAMEATLISNAKLHQQAAFQSSVLTTLTTGSKVESIKRKGGWRLIKTLGERPQYGWVRSYKVRQGHITVVNNQQKSNGFFSGLASISRKASGLFSSKKTGYSFQNTATIGVRGLSEKDIKNAQPNLKQLQLLDTYKTSKKAALTFAQQGQLKSVKIAHLPSQGAQ